MDDIVQVRDLVVPHVAGLWAASGKKEIEREWKAIHDLMDRRGLTWMVDAVEQYQDAPSFVAWVKDSTIPPFPPVAFNVTLHLERTDDGYLMRWDIACVRTDEPDAWVARYRVVMNAADEGGKGILRHLTRTDVLLFSLMSGKDHVEIHANQRGQPLLAALSLPVWRGLFPVEWPQEQRERCRDFLVEIEANSPAHLMGAQDLLEHQHQTMPGLNWQPMLDAEG
jgi:hypothetical protein